MQNDDDLVRKSIEDLTRIYELHLAKTGGAAGGNVQQPTQFRPEIDTTTAAGGLPVTPPLDVVLLTALSDEYQELMRVLPPRYQDTIRLGLWFDFVKLPSPTGDVSVACVNIDGMGPVKAAIATTKVIVTLRPKLAILVGICASGQDDVALGDVVVAERAYDYDSGKLLNGEFLPEYEPIEIQPSVRTIISHYCTNHALAQRISAEFTYLAGKPANPPAFRLGTFASGSKVLADKDYVASIKKHNRKIHGIDMEVYAFYRACWEAAVTKTIFLAVKSVQDKAGSDKADDYRQYCSYAAACFVKSFISDNGSALWLNA